MPRITSIKNIGHELLAAMLARYSRSNLGIGKIMSQVDFNEPDKSVDKIFKFVDYGHASIGGLTNGIPIAIDDVSMFLAYKIFEISSMADGQESSTRYITLNNSKLPLPKELGIPDDLADEWQSVMYTSFDTYQRETARLGGQSDYVPSSTDPKVIKRMKKNYILDRTRYYIPFATKTNVALIQNARMWAQTVRHLDSMPQIEANTVAGLIRDELKKYTPRLIKHSFSEKSYALQCEKELHDSCGLGLDLLSTEEQTDNAWVHVDKVTPLWLPNTQVVEDGLGFRSNRYGYFGAGFRRMRVAFGWENIAIAELRDLNRHRTGNKYSPLIQSGFYTGCKRDEKLLARQRALLTELMGRGSPAYVYGLLLGSQTPFEHSTHGDKFIYEAELRTGLGAHYKYAEHMSNVLKKFYKYVPEAQDYVLEGRAEPE